LVIGERSGKLTLPQAKRSDMSPEKPNSSAQPKMAKEDKPASISAARRIGFMDGEGIVPDDFDQMHAEEIRALFEDGPLFPDELRR
jgi:hypothetical protein